jgi:hypothetical protein
MLVTWLGTAGVLDVNVVLGAVLMAVVVFLPNGLVPSLAGLAAAMRRHTVPARMAGLVAEAQPEARG